MYEVPEQRHPGTVIAALVPPDADYTIELLLDAIRVLPHFGDPDQPIVHGRFIPADLVLGSHRNWTYPDVLAVLHHAFGPEGHDNTKHIVSYLPAPDHTPDDDYCRRAALLLHAGWTQTDGWLWWTRLTGRSELLLEVASDWVSAWNLDSLNACIRVGMGLPALTDILGAGVLPPPASIEALLALRASMSISA